MKPNSRWIQLVVGIICMVMIANLQYGWTYFVDPMNAKYHWGRTDIQIAFTIFIATETWLVPVEGWFVDRFGPRIVIMFGGIVVALGWSLNSVASSLPMLYFAAALSGIGAGAVYGTCVGNALKWFTDRRGLAAGLTAAGFGAGAAATVYPIIQTIKTYGYESAFLWFGVGQGLIVLVLSQFPRAPKACSPSPGTRSTASSRRPVPISTGRNIRPPMQVCSTRRRAPRRSWCRRRAGFRARPAAGMRSSWWRRSPIWRLPPPPSSSSSRCGRPSGRPSSRRRSPTRLNKPLIFRRQMVPHRRSRLPGRRRLPVARTECGRRDRFARADTAIARLKLKSLRATGAPRFAQRDDRGRAAAGF